MKTIKQGEKPEPMKPWWVGQQVHCGRCKAVYGLEEGDPVYTYRRMDRFPAATEAQLSCPCCSATIIVKHPSALKTQDPPIAFYHKPAPDLQDSRGADIQDPYAP